jgi:hypothetical protein
MTSKVENWLNISFFRTMDSKTQFTVVFLSHKTYTRLPKGAQITFKHDVPLCKQEKKTQENNPVPSWSQLSHVQELENTSLQEAKISNFLATNLLK